jgi:DNA-binding IclR family transcriptional regulator
VCIDRQEGAFPIRTYTQEIGTRRPLGIGAGSLAILSALPENEIGEVIELNRTRLGAYNDLTAKKLMRLVKETQALGFAVHDGSVSGARAIGLALRDGKGVPFAGISVSAITSRMQEARWPEIVQRMREHAKLIEGEAARVKL